MYVYIQGDSSKLPTWKSLTNTDEKKKNNNDCTESICKQLAKAFTLMYQVEAGNCYQECY